MEEIIQQCINPSRERCFQGMEDEMISTFLCTFFYMYWNNRNSFVHAQLKKLENLVTWFNFLVEELATKNKDLEMDEMPQPTRFEATQSPYWSLPQEGWFKINTDAAYDQGKTVIGMIVRDDRGRHCYSTAKTIDSGSVLDP